MLLLFLCSISSYSVQLTRDLLQSFNAPENCGFTRWVDPSPIHPHAEYIYYLQNRIFDLEREVSSFFPDEAEDDNGNGADSQEEPCTDPYCKCPITRRTCLLHHRHHRRRLLLQWEDTMEKDQHNLLCGISTKCIRSYSHVASLRLL